MVNRRMVVGLFLLLGVGLASGQWDEMRPSAIESDTDGTTDLFSAMDWNTAPGRFTQGTWTVGGYTGYGFDVFRRPTRHTGIGSGGLALGAYVRDNFSVNVELEGDWIAMDGGSAQGGGATLIHRFHLYHHGPFSLFLDGGAGVIYANNRFPTAAGSYLNFTPQGGLSFSYALSPDWMLIVSPRYLHVSNANSRGDDRNPAMDGFRLVAGIHYLFGPGDHGATVPATMPGVVSDDPAVTVEYDFYMRLAAQARTGDNVAEHWLRYGSDGCVRINPQAGTQYAVGYNVVYTTFVSDDALLSSWQPTNINGWVSSQWQADASWGLTGRVGVGYAGVSPFASDRGLYTQARAVGWSSLGGGWRWQGGLSWDQSRAIWPDVPLPVFGVSYQSGDMALELGFPDAGVRWQITEPWSLSARYRFPLDGSLEVAWSPTGWLDVELLAGYACESYAIESDRSRRLMYQYMRVENALVFRPWVATEMRLGGGVMPDQQLRTGWDVLSARLDRRLSVQPYLFFRISAEF